MSEPTIAGTHPNVVELEPGTYFWCACGLSANQPFCDGSHRGTEFVPVKLEITENGRAALCMCKRTGDQPRCDGTHSTLR
jgi:CDGSH-type Zn-finger protein